MFKKNPLNYSNNRLNLWNKYLQNNSHHEFLRIMQDENFFYIYHLLERKNSNFITIFWSLKYLILCIKATIRYIAWNEKNLKCYMEKVLFHVSSLFSVKFANHCSQCENDETPKGFSKIRWYRKVFYWKIWIISSITESQIKIQQKSLLNYLEGNYLHLNALSWLYPCLFIEKVKWKIIQFSLLWSFHASSFCLMDKDVALRIL